MTLTIKTLFLITLLAAFSMSVSAATFKGYQCTQDCSGHRAGYAWAQKKGIDSKNDCKGNSRSFIEGCYAWVDEVNARNRM